MGWPLIAGAIMGATALYKGMKETLPKYDMTGMNAALDMINKQYNDVNQYFNEAGSAFEGQYKRYYGETMSDAISTMANQGIYESPVSERQLGRIRTGLAETYATGKSQLAGQKLSAMSAIDQQKVTYYQNLANIQYNRDLAKYQRRMSLFGGIGGIGTALMGMGKE